MSGHRARIGFAAFLFGGVALAASTFAGTGDAQAFGDRYERFAGYQAQGWRPPPPAFHGYWGQRRWHRYYNDGYGMRPPPPRYGYGYGWR